ncbi:hypothetical protein PV682_43105 [Streptomyces niveiscabiei]|uniref:hypothetical protein n=1 Tax=Streptomyces niveiscabiei TaxID=164115 RepID=UPI0029AF56B1|nr:hypothetical protein [Streptomyces niveiscabiei]MDX3388182.1 hypothetical protein [Streptomyces niveiscabiei]
MTELVWSRSRAKRGSLLVMLALAREADDRGWVSLSLEQIAKLARLSARAVTNCLPELSALGELSYTPGSGRAVTNRYSLLLGASEEREAGSGFPEAAAETRKSEPETPKSLPGSQEASSAHPGAGSTPVGSTTSSEQQASLLPPRTAPTRADSVPAGARDLVAALTNAGMVVGWRLTEDEWARVTALSARWGAERLVEVISRRWDPGRPPQSARYLLRIWDDLPTQVPAPNVVPLRRESGGWKPYRNPARADAYQNGF